MRGHPLHATHELVGQAREQGLHRGGEVVGVNLIAAKKELVGARARVLVFVIVEYQVVDHRQRVRVRMAGSAA